MLPLSTADLLSPQQSQRPFSPTPSRRHALSMCIGFQIQKTSIISSVSDFYQRHDVRILHDEIGIFALGNYLAI